MSPDGRANNAAGRHAAQHTHALRTPPAALSNFQMRLPGASHCAPNSTRPGSRAN